MTANTDNPMGRNRLFLVAAAAICVLIFWLDLKDLTKLPLDVDEAFSVSLALLPWGQCWHGAVADATHPPVFTLLLKLWMTVGGHSLLWLRLFPALAALLLLIPVYLLLREFRFPPIGSILALAAVAASTPRIEYSQVVRSYSLYALMAGFSMWLFARNARRQRVGAGWTAAYVAASVALCCLHYFGMWILGIQFLLAVFFYRSEFRRVCLAGALQLGLMLLWVPQAAHSMSAGRKLNDFIGWMSRPTPATVLWLYHVLLGGLSWPHAVAVGLLLVLPPLGFWAVRLLQKQPPLKTSSSTDLLMQFGAYATIPVIGTWALSVAGPVSLFGPRVLLFTVVPYCLLIAYAVVLMEPRWLQAVFSLAMLVWCVSSGIAQLWRPDRSPRWDEIAACVSSDPAGASVPLLAAESFVYTPYHLMLQFSGDHPERIALQPALDGALPDSFWAGYRDFAERPEYAKELTSRLGSQDYKVVRQCKANEGSYAIIFDLNRKGGTASLAR